LQALLATGMLSQALLQQFQHSPAKLGATQAPTPAQELQRFFISLFQPAHLQPALKLFPIGCRVLWEFADGGD
jgi:hypothetical protein